MHYLNSDGSVCPLKLSREIKTLARNVNDSIYYCFEDLSNDKKILALEAYTKLLTLANELERQSDELFR